MKFEEKTIKRQQIFKGRIIDVNLDTVLLPDGRENTRELVFHPGAVAVLAITKDKKIVLVEQFRKPLERTLLEIPAGKLELNEDPYLCAERELEEETGYYSPNGLQKLTSFYVSPGFANEIVHIYYAKDVVLKENKRDGDDDEFVLLHEYTFEEFEKLALNGTIQDAKTMYAYQYLKIECLQDK